MEEDFDDDLAEEGLPTAHEAVTPGKGILLLPHRQMHPHSQLLRARPSLDQEPRVTFRSPHPTHSHLGGQDHGDWTYEEQFRQVQKHSHIYRQRFGIRRVRPTQFGKGYCCSCLKR